MKRSVRILATIIVLPFLILEFGGLNYCIDDGAPEVKLNIDCAAERPRSIRCEAFGPKIGAEQTVEFMEFEGTSIYSGIADPFEGKPMSFRVGVSYSTSMCGRTLSRSQYHRYLAVIAVMHDGKRIGKVAEIPDVRVSREMTVCLP